MILFPLEAMTGPYKTCVKCDKHKPLYEFYAHKATLDKVQSYCKRCSNRCALETYHRNKGYKLIQRQRRSHEHTVYVWRQPDAHH